MTVKDGLYQHFPWGEYNLLNRVNFSSLKWMGKSPAMYRHKLLEKAPKDTDQRKLGRATHLATLEPERFRSDCVVWTEGRRAGNVWKAFKEANVGRELLREKEHDHCLAIQRAVRADATAAKYLAGGRGEVSMFWTHKVQAIGGLSGYEMKCKGRIDFEAELPAIVDLKTTRDASPEGFSREAWNYRYHTQAAYYVDGYEAITSNRLPYIIVAVESAAPYVVQVYRVPDAILDLGREEYRDLLDRLNFCLSNSKWPGYADGELELTLPRWAAPTGADEDITGLDLDFQPAALESA